MLGLLVILIGFIYLLISIGIIYFAARKAKQREIAGWKWGVPAALFMYFIVFLDHIPTVIAHTYYCKKEAGFTVYKTLKQWKEENPGVAESLDYEEFSASEGDRNKYVRHLNQRFDSVFTRTTVFLSIKQRKYQIIDKSNNEVLAEYIDYSSGGGFQNANTLTDYKLWLANNSCEVNMKTDILFFEFSDNAKKIGDEKL